MRFCMFRFGALATAVLGVSVGAPAALIENFDAFPPGFYKVGPVELISGTWDANAVYGADAIFARGGSGKAAQLNDDTSNAYFTTPELASGAGTLTFWRRALNTDDGIIDIQVSTTDQASGFTTITSVPFSGTEYVQETITIEQSGSVWIRILNDNHPGHLIIDDLYVTDYIIAGDDPDINASPTVDFGIIDPSAAGQGNIVVTNNGLSAVLDVTAVNFISGDSAAFSMGTLPTGIAAGGGTGNIPVTFDPAGNAGSYNAVYEIVSNDESGDIINVALSAKAAVAVQPGDVVINEISYDDDDADTESFIELKNVSANAADMSQLELVGLNGNGLVEYGAVTLSGSLAPGDYYLIASSSNSSGLSGYTFDATFGDNPQNGPDGIFLRRLSDSAIIDSVSYEGGTTPIHPAGSPDSGDAGASSSEGMALARYPDGIDTNDNGADFITQAFTPGASNGGIDNTAPTVDSITPNPGSIVRGALAFTVVFSEDVQNVTDDDFTINMTGSVHHAGILVVQNNAASYEVGFLNLDGTGELTFNANLGSDIQDAAGNALGGTVNDVTVTVDNTVPSSTITAPATKVGGDIPVTLASSSDVNTSVVGVELFVETPVSGAFATAGNITSGSLNYTPADGAGIYTFYSVATDEADNIEAAEANTIAVIYNPVENGEMTFDVPPGDSTISYPFSDNFNPVTLNFIGVLAGDTVTIQRIVGLGTAPATGLIENRLLDEYLVISSGLPDGTFSAEIVYTYNPASDSGSVGTIDTVFHYQGTTFVETLIPTLGTNSVTFSTDSFSEFYIGNNAAPVNDWMLLDD